MVKHFFIITFIRLSIMKLNQLILSCYARCTEGQWVAFCLDFDLAAQASTFEEAKTKLENMIKQYVFDALVGEDRAYAEQLLSRKAPPLEWIKYYFFVFIHRFIHAKAELYRLFKEPLPLTPYSQVKI
jgi:predicted RNase H-like HicB family nuclease